ncbi:MAG: class I SAM-dependent methyltransferase [Cytophagaceae bacterium]|nr:class I SAM-dependent methyltransferase [Cytophagaceae bacterium]MBL0326108.1 class I SAM-dependent methyltransferase [Cytophagaceae bacterium]
MSNDPWTQRWNERYGQSEYAYGEEPNEFLKEKIGAMSPGNALFPAEGEGRNGVFAAKLGWKVSAFDLSEEGMKKAIKLAGKHSVFLDYQVGELQNLNYKNDSFDLVALIFAHFPAEIKSEIHQSLTTLLKKGGIVIFEAFSKKHLDYQAKNPAVGGPRDLGSLFSLEEIKNDFNDFEFLELEEKEIELSEGQFHSGLGSVIRFIGKKK